MHPPIDYESPTPPPRRHPPLRSGVAILAFVWALLLNPLFVSTFVPMPSNGLTVAGHTILPPTLRLALPATFGVLLCAAAAVHVITSRGERRGGILVLLAFVFNALWLLLAISFEAATRNWKGD